MSRIRNAVIGALLAGPLAVLAAPAPAGAGADATVGALLRALAIDIPAGALPAPAFELPDLQGRLTALEASRGRVVMLYFWTTY